MFLWRRQVQSFSVWLIKAKHLLLMFSWWQFMTECENWHNVKLMAYRNKRTGNCLVAGATQTVTKSISWLQQHFNNICLSLLELVVIFFCYRLNVIVRMRILIITNIVTFFLVYSPYISSLVEVHCRKVVSPTQRHKRKKSKSCWFTSRPVAFGFVY